jgi:hypothetical protein
VNCAVRALIALSLITLCSESASSAAPAPATPARSTPAPKIDLDAVKPLESLLDKALLAYNSGNATLFFADFAASAIPPAEPRIFAAVFEGVYKTEFGKYVSKKLNVKETVSDPNRGVLVYDAVFEKKNVKLSANFPRESGGLKIVQIRMEKL